MSESQAFCKRTALSASGRKVSAREAQTMGLVSRVFSDSNELLEGARATLDEIVGKSPFAVAVCKRVINGTVGMEAAASLAVERAGFRKAFTSEDRAAGTSAFLEKRKPLFVGW